MATAKKLPSGNYRIRKYTYTDENGKKHYKSFTAKTKKEAERLCATWSGDAPDQDLTLKEAFDIYLDEKSNILSPSTIIGYNVAANYWKDLWDIKMKNLNQRNVSNFINTFCKNHSPKTVRNAYGFLTSVMSHLDIPRNFSVDMPQKVPVSYRIPTEEAFQQVVDYIKDHDNEMYKAILLGSIGMMRRSEICALRHSDFSGNVVHVHRAMVINKDREWIIKETKNVTSDRYVDLPDNLIDVLDIKKGSDELIMKIDPNIVSERFRLLFENLDVPRFRFHDCRHYGTSLLHAIGVPDLYIQQRGGWSSDKVMKQVYRNTMDDFYEKYSNIANDHLKKMIK